jgi:hypothetical protein
MATTAERTWKIRDQLPTGAWGPEREVTLAQYRAEVDAATSRARAIHQANVATVAAEQRR